MGKELTTPVLQGTGPESYIIFNGLFAVFLAQVLLKKRIHRMYFTESHNTIGNQ